MGRRKIEIRAIKDDRNRSVTFLKRKGGLFKKAHELSVLCSVDVAVIIFGHNKKLYEFSSGDINETLRRYQYYGPPHEHKGPGDFKGKGGGGDDDDDDDEEGDDGSMKREDSVPPQHNMMPPHMQQHPWPHLQNTAALGSPPMQNGMFQQRHSTPQPGQVGSRSNSRNEIRRSSSNIVPMSHPHNTPTPPQNGFAYVPNPPIYNPHAAVQAAVPPPQPSPQPPYQPFHQQQQQQQPPSTAPPPPPQPQQPGHQQGQPGQQQYAPEQRRQSHPPSNNSLQPPAQPPPRSSPQPEQSQTLRPPSPPAPPPVRRNTNSKSQSIFTPIDEGGSVLARHFFGAPEPPKRDDRDRNKDSPDLKPPPRTMSQPTPGRHPPPRLTANTEFPPPQRSDTGGSRSGASRPKLNLQIPSEAEENEDGSGSARQSAGPSANPERHGIVLPPPSPSASALLSAGASGPPNPFARPPPPTSQQNSNAYSENRGNVDTPVSALPSRYMEQSLLASPSGLFSDWDNWGRGLNSAVLPSPLTFPTPADAKGPGFGRGDPNDEKRKADSELSGEAKKIKT